MSSDCRVGHFSVLKWNTLENCKTEMPCSLDQALLTFLENLSPGERPAELGYFLKDERKANSMTLNDIFIHLS